QQAPTRQAGAQGWGSDRREGRAEPRPDATGSAGSTLLSPGRPATGTRARGVARVLRGGGWPHPSDRTLVGAGTPPPSPRLITRHIRRDRWLIYATCCARPLLTLDPIPMPWRE